MKIQFAPLNVPLQRRLQTAAVLQWVFSFLALAQCCLAAFVLLALSDWWILALLYAGWLWLDWDTPTTGGRRFQWVRNWTVWEYLRDYFPLTLVKTVDLDPTKNYIFGFHPHEEAMTILEVLDEIWWTSDIEVEDSSDSSVDLEEDDENISLRRDPVHNASTIWNIMPLNYFLYTSLTILFNKNPPVGDKMIQFSSFSFH
ncbi:hypothetical protein ILYODFUR_023802 [Ilyodon furcidens]|uniref:Uncharacterized protein n=1 Tax=Ilyodon furcidens TaxID=33524 RepID=A0ABV0V7I9_9TELE